MIDPNYQSLDNILHDAFNQASFGKGKERHAPEDTPFEEQLICLIERYGLSFCEGQAVKKIFEASQMGPERGEPDKLGAINYIAASILVDREKI